MKRALVIVLAILKITVVDPTDVNAKTRLEQLIRQYSLEQVKESEQQLLTSLAQA